MKGFKTSILFVAILSAFTLLLAGCGRSDDAAVTTTLVSITVTPSNPSITVGTTQQFTATGTYSDSSTQNITASVTWSSSYTSKATINNAGLATAVAVGSTTITATSGGISGSTMLTVTGAVNLPQTGQTTCYDAGGNVIDCAGTGQDGELKKGVAWPSQRFTDNTNGTVTDNLTGLIWLKNANCANGTRTWATALTDVAQLNTNGTMNGNNCGDTSNGGSHQTDWRLPNRKELMSLIDRSKFNPVLPTGHPFTNVQSDYYWSSTTSASGTGGAWGVYMMSGHVSFHVKTVNYYVWPVRAGQ